MNEYAFKCLNSLMNSGMGCGDPEIDALSRGDKTAIVLEEILKEAPFIESIDSEYNQEPLNIGYAGYNFGIAGRGRVKYKITFTG